MIRILLIDDHAILRQGIRLVIDCDDGMEIVGEAGDPQGAVRATLEAQPDVILLDLDIGGSSGTALIPELMRSAPAARILILTGLVAVEEHLRAMRAGAAGVVLKAKAVEELRAAIRKVYAGEFWLDRTLVKTLLSEKSPLRNRLHPEQSNTETLTQREREIISLLGEGLRNRQIGERLFISEGTVKQHLSTIFSKLGVHDRFELIVYAYQHGLAHPPLHKDEPQ